MNQPKLHVSSEGYHTVITKQLCEENGWNGENISALLYCMLTAHILHKEHNHVCALPGSFPWTRDKHPTDINTQYVNLVQVHARLK
jgi:hypothetical protein